MIKPRLIFGIALTFLGGCIMLIGMIQGIIRYSTGAYRDIHTFPISLNPDNGSRENLRFRTKGKVDFSFWLKMPDRKIENKRFRFGVDLISNEGVRHASFKENFRFGYLRNSSGKGQYYRLGRYHSEDEFNGYLQCQSSGKWRPTSDGFIVLRRKEPVATPVKSIWIFCFGLAGMILGVVTIVKYRVLRPTPDPSGKTGITGSIRFKSLKNQETIPN